MASCTFFPWKKMNWLYSLKHCRQRKSNAFSWVAYLVSWCTHAHIVKRAHDQQYNVPFPMHSIHSGSIQDKIFIACDNKVKAYNKKGKMFLTFTSSLTEPIKSMYVSGNDMILCGNHVYNHYRDCKDIGSYLCGDTIVDAAAVCPNNVIAHIQMFQHFFFPPHKPNVMYDRCFCRHRG